MNFIKRLFASDNARNLEKIEKIVAQIEALDGDMAKLTDDQLKEYTQKLKDRYANGETLDEMLPEAFALIREASSRVLKMKHFHSQLIGGVALFQGRIAEMSTGEGKTFVATLPCFLCGLSGKGVHVVTVNDYLARRDAEWMGKVHRFLGLTVGLVYSMQPDSEKKKAYACDITYATNNELGFDYLRDNMKDKLGDKVQREFNVAIIDEVDSILIDEARTPLIISGPGFKSSDNYVKAQKFFKVLSPEDYEIDEEKRAVRLNESGIEKAENFYQVEDLYDVDNVELNQFINNALQANTLFKIDHHYILNENEILLVDEFTGRVMQGRRLSNGLHQAIEAKEGVEIKDESATLATITFQNYFRLYKKLSGMTGTAKTEETEFRKIYGLDVLQIPTNKPVIRKDEKDIVYVNIPGKNRAIVEHIKEAHATGQPILVGTTTVAKSEELSNELKKAKIKHHVLNAKNHELESLIVAQAGRLGQVTIATNMAGRGTDILLGGNAEFMAKQKLKEMGFNDAQIELATGYGVVDNEEIKRAKAEYEKAYAEFKKETDAEKAKVVELGGLLIIGTERHESRRIDNQLRGRAGRQGDPGESIFYISLEDDLARIFGGDRIRAVANFFKLQEDEPIRLGMLSKYIEQAQKKIEGNNYSQRRYLIEYDDVLNKQRELIYGERNKVLQGINMHDEIVDMLSEQVANDLSEVVDENRVWSEWNIKEINDKLEQAYFAHGENFINEEKIEGMELPELKEFVIKEVVTRYENKKTEFDKIIEEKVQELPGLQALPFDAIERYILLRFVDRLWMEHIDTMSALKREIGAQAFGNQDPIIPYKKEGRQLFEDMIEKIRRNVSLTVYRLQKPEIKVRASTPIAMKAEQERQKQARENAKPVQAKTDKVAGRNDPCPCGSGKKYKNCCGKTEE